MYLRKTHHLLLMSLYITHNNITHIQNKVQNTKHKTQSKKQTIKTHQKKQNMSFHSVSRISQPFQTYHGSTNSINCPQKLTIPSQNTDWKKKKLKFHSFYSSKFNTQYTKNTIHTYVPSFLQHSTSNFHNPHTPYTIPYVFSALLSFVSPNHFANVLSNTKNTLQKKNTKPTKPHTHTNHTNHIQPHKSKQKQKTKPKNKKNKKTQNMKDHSTTMLKYFS